MRVRPSLVLMVFVSIFSTILLVACGSSGPAAPVSGSPTTAPAAPSAATQAAAPTASGTYQPPPTQPAAPTASSTYPAPGTQPAQPTASGTYPAPNAQPARPAASGTYPAPTTSLPTPSVVTATVTPKAGTSGVQLPGTASGITIDVTAPGSTPQTLSPGETAYVQVNQSGISVLVHYPNPIGTGSGAGFVPYQVTTAVDPAGWRAEMATAPDDHTLALRLVGNATGHFTVSISSMPTNPSVTFGINVANPLTPTTSSTTGNPAAGRTVTLADNGKTLQLHVGDRFLLDLGVGFDWTVNVADQNVVSRVVNIAVIRGAQGVYAAHQVGQTTLSAVGDPPCRQAKPACALPSRLFKITLDVQ